MLFITDRHVLAMALLRVFSGIVELTTAVLIIRFGHAATALRLNTIPAAVGLTVLLLATFIGIAGLAGKISPFKVALIGTGILLILLGTRNLSS